MTPHKVLVIGASILDIAGYPIAQLRSNDSNPGHIYLTAGGVARNIAENLALLQVDTHLLSAIGNDVWGQILQERCQQAHINIEHSVYPPNAASALYLAINNDQRDLAVAIVNTTIIDHICPTYLHNKASIINHFPLLVVDTNLREDTLHYLCTNFAHIPIYLDVVSTTKAQKVKDFVGKFHTLKANKAEATAMSGIEGHTLKALLQMRDYFMNKGTQQVFITLGKDGSFYANTSTYGLVAPTSITVTNTSGAGDAYMAGLVYAHLQQQSQADAAIFASAMSIAALMSQHTVNPQLHLSFIQDIIKKHPICLKNTLT